MMILYKLATILRVVQLMELVGQVIVAISMLAVEKQPASNYDQRLIIMRMAAEAASKALGSFTGARRRFELIGKVQGCYIIDDYAHHPTEVRAVLQGARQRFRQQPIWVIFQPHTFR
jgi:UDP-N-acetylmuramoylalanine-D-glutamate ligase